MSRRVIPLKRSDRCVICAVDLPAGTTAEWDSAARTVTCQACLAGPAGPAAAVAPPADLPPPVEPPPIDVGVAGASARKEYDRRHAKRERQIEEKWGTGRLGRIAKALSDDPQTTKAWREGAAGEEIVAKALTERLGDRAVLLHDRKVPRTNGNIDHVAIASSGVWVIDAKRHKGRVERKDVGRWLRADIRLYVDGRDRSKLVEKLGWQVDAVTSTIGDPAVPVHPTLSFVGAEWSFFAKPLRIDGVLVAWPRKLADLIAEPGPLADDQVEHLARLLSQRLPAN